MPIKLGKHQRVMMMQLANADIAGCSVVELNDTLPPSTVRHGLRGLIARGYVERTTDPNNLRCHRYWIKDSGMDWVQAMEATNGQV